jgi:hypothetical protein
MSKDQLKKLLAAKLAAKKVVDDLWTTRSDDFDAMIAYDVAFKKYHAAEMDYSAAVSTFAQQSVRLDASDTDDLKDGVE